MPPVLEGDAGDPVPPPPPPPPVLTVPDVIPVLLGLPPPFPPPPKPPAQQQPGHAFPETVTSPPPEAKYLDEPTGPGSPYEGAGGPINVSET